MSTELEFCYLEVTWKYQSLIRPLSSKCKYVARLFRDALLLIFLLVKHTMIRNNWYIFTQLIH